MPFLLLFPIQFLLFSLASPSEPYISRVHYESYPHIVESIITHADYNTRLRCRATCRALRQFTDKLLLARAARVEHLLTGCAETGILLASVIAPFTGTAYPFFKSEGDLRAQRARLNKYGTFIIINDAEATAVNPLLGRLQWVLIDHHRRNANYRMPDFDRPSMLKIGMEWQCSCGSSHLHPAFSHGATNVTISLHENDEIPGEGGRLLSEITLQPGLASQCHLLQNVLNGGVLQLGLIVHLLISEDSIEHLPAYVLPGARTVDLNAAFACNVKIPANGSNQRHFLDKVQFAFAEHLGIPRSKVYVEQSEESKVSSARPLEMQVV